MTSRKCWKDHSRITGSAAMLLLLTLVATDAWAQGRGQGRGGGQPATLETLDCSIAGQVAKFDGTDWVCGEDNDSENTDTLADLSCSTDEIARYDGSEWVCATVNSLISIYEVRRPVTLESNPTLPVTTFWRAFCRVGDLAIGGGFETPAGSFDYRVTDSRRYTSDTRAWSTSILVAPDTITLDGAVLAYCLDLTP